MAVMVYACTTLAFISGKQRNRSPRIAVRVRDGGMYWFLGTKCTRFISWRFCALHLRRIGHGFVAVSLREVHSDSWLRVFKRKQTHRKDVSMKTHSESVDAPGIWQRRASAALTRSSGRAITRRTQFLCLQWCCWCQLWCHLQFQWCWSSLGYDGDSGDGSVMIIKLILGRMGWWRWWYVAMMCW